MKTKNKKGPGESLVEQQKSTDEAINQRIKEQRGKEKLDPTEANNPEKRNRNSTPSKKTGGGKQKNPGM